MSEDSNPREIGVLVKPPAAPYGAAEGGKNTDVRSAAAAEIQGAKSWRQTFFG